MYQRSFKQGRLARLVAASLAGTALAISLAGCQTAGLSDVTGSLGEKAEASQAAATQPSEPHLGPGCDRA